MLIAAARMAEQETARQRREDRPHHRDEHHRRVLDLAEEHPPMRPEATEKIRMMKVQLMPMTLDLRRSLLSVWT